MRASTKLLLLFGGNTNIDVPLSGSLLDLDSLTVVSTDGTAIATWADQSGHGNDAAQATGGKQPTYKVNILNGKPVLRFAGGQAMKTPAIDFSAAPGITIYLIASAVTGTTQIWLELGPNATAATNAFYAARVSSNWPESYHKGNVGASNDRNVTDPMTSPQIYSAILDIVPVSRESNTFVNSVRSGALQNDSNNTALTYSNDVINIGGRNGTSLFVTGDYGKIMLYPAIHNASQRHWNERYIARRFGYSWNKVANVVFDGDSITFGASVALLSDYPSQVMASFAADGKIMAWENYAVSGQTLFATAPSCESQFPTLIAREASTIVKPNIYFILAGTNDATALATAAQIYAHYQSLAATARAAGFKVIVCTLTDRTDGAKPAGFDTLRATLNASILADTTSFDGVADFGGNATMGANGASANTTYFTGGLHPTAAGDTILAGIAKTAIAALL